MQEGFLSKLQLHLLGCRGIAKHRSAAGASMVAAVQKNKIQVFVLFLAKIFYGKAAGNRARATKKVWLSLPPR